MKLSDKLPDNHIIGIEKMKKLKERAAEFGVSVETIFSGVWGILLQRYKNSPNVTYAVVNHKKIQSIVNIIYKEKQSIAEYFKMVQNETSSYVKGSTNEITSIIRIYEYDQHHRKNFENNKLIDMSMSVLIGDPTKFEVNLYEKYKDDVELPQRITDHYSRVIELILNDSSLIIDDIDILTAKEKHQALFEFNNTEYLIPQSTIQELFEDQVIKSPKKIACVYKNQSITYEKMNQKANQIARAIIDSGVKEGEVVALTLDRSLEMFIAILGVLKARCICLPLNINNPDERIDYFLIDSKTKLIITKNFKSSVFEGEFLDLGKSKLSKYGTNNLGLDYCFKDSAYIFYTSGSTGKPKGVLLEHNGIVNHAFAKIIDLQMGCDDVISHNLNLTFAASVWQFFSPLFIGAKVVIFPEEVLRNPVLLFQQINTFRISILEVVPSFLKSYLQTFEYGNPKIDFSFLRILILTGEKVSPQLVNNFYNYYNIQLMNAYGQTECTDDTLHYIIPFDTKTKDVPIGKPIINTKTFVVDIFNNIQAYGFPGELTIAGESVSPGYINNQINNRFVENLIPEHGKVFRTGDIVRLNSDGNFEYLGRKDFQVKIRGHRIEIEEIESIILGIEGIKDAAVLVEEDDESENRLIAFIVLKKTGIIENIYQSLEYKLPNYMFPSKIIQLDELPLNNNGKIDRKALLNNYKNKVSTIDTSLLAEQYLGRTLTTNYVAPVSEIEKELVLEWEKVFGIRPIGISDKFIELGGHSLKAMILSTIICNKFNVNIPSTTFFYQSTIQEIAEYVKNAEKSLIIDRVEEKETYLASAVQKRMFVVSQLEEESITYNIPYLLEMEGELDTVKLQKAIYQLLQRHETLRTSFETIGDELHQKINDDVELLIESLELGEQNINNIALDFVKPFNLSNAPLLRVKLIKVNSNQHILMIDIHHIISDGLSMNIFLKDLATFYSGEKLEPLKIQYKDFSNWQNNFIQSKGIKNQEKYWLKHISDYEPLRLPLDYSRSYNQPFEGETINFELDSEIVKRLKVFSKNNEVTLYTLLLAAFNVLLYRYTDEADIVVGSLVAGRNNGDLNNVIGMFVNTVALRNQPEGNKNFSDFLLEVKENVLKAHENQDYPFDKLVKKLGIKRELNRNPLFDTMFILQNTITDFVEFEGLKTQTYPYKSRISKFDITLSAEEHMSKLLFEIEYSNQLFKKDTIERMVGHYQNILKTVIKQPKIKLKDIEVLSEREQNQLLKEFNDTGKDYPKEQTIHQVFEEQVAKNPKEVALIFESEKLTYAQLNEMSDKLAHQIRKFGIDRERVVGIMLDKSFEIVIGMLAILKAGGTYLPIDPQFPVERIYFILEDSNTQLLLTQQKYANNINFDHILNVENLDQNSTRD
ncbi:amino acid adenylation domain-containing protein [Lysinibacillus sp. NPDC059133]|uniref:amino acid adenylation domain-containing protein n=1 Tax=Lysinibacillus sp. NPDC059133 TaxID=3346737 RepID=UPI0036B3BFF8